MNMLLISLNTQIGAASAMVISNMYRILQSLLAIFANESEERKRKYIVIICILHFAKQCRRFSTIRLLSCSSNKIEVDDDQSNWKTENCDGVDASLLSLVDLCAIDTDICACTTHFPFKPFLSKKKLAVCQRCPSQVWLVSKLNTTTTTKNIIINNKRNRNEKFVTIRNNFASGRKETK